MVLDSNIQTFDIFINLIISEYYNSGLDPAGPTFTEGIFFPIKEPLEKRLDKSDAKYVQCVHTAQTSFGTLNDCGHANFYINKGRDQPACPDGDIICSHGMAHEYFSESMLSNHVFEGPHCGAGVIKLLAKHYSLIRIPLLDAVDKWLRNDCDNSRIDKLGIHSRMKAGRFFVETNSKYPYAKHVIESSSISWFFK